MADEYLTVKELVEYSKMSERTIFKYLRATCCRLTPAS